MTYSEKLKDPRWQKIRLQVFERDGWKCVSCGDSENTLNVHHCYYERGKEPWEYDEDSLVTMCNECHEIEPGFRYESETRLLKILRESGYIAQDFNQISWILTYKPTSCKKAIREYHYKKWERFLDEDGKNE